MAVFTNRVAASIAGESRATGFRVLVVDDNDDVAQCLVMLLHHLGHLPLGCCSGRDCLAYLFEFRPQVILLDLSMPLQDGFETCRQIRRVAGYEEIPIIACSAMDEYLVRDRIDECAFTSYLGKPVLSRELQNAIDKVCRKKRPA